MRLRIEDTCTFCGLCESTCPEVFWIAPDEALIIGNADPPEFEEAVQQAAEECPVEAIILK